MDKAQLDEIIHVIEEVFTEHGNPVLAKSAETYMKGHFPYFGIMTPERRAVQKEWLNGVNEINDRNDRWQLVRALWEKPQREFQYLAIDWMNSWPKKWYDPNDGEELEFLLRKKPWWDSTDAISTNYIGKWQKLFPKDARKTFEKWRHSDLFWLQRTCLIYQLKYKDEVDISYLEDLIAQLLQINEFFIQKAIGWSLRQLSKRNPDAVREILGNHPVKGLALREASKYLN